MVIACEEPNDEGKMRIEMTYEGDTDLVSYLLASAQALLEDEEEGQPQES